MLHIETLSVINTFIAPTKFTWNKKMADSIIKIDKKKDKLLEDYAVGMLQDFYLNEHEKSPPRSIC